MRTIARLVLIGSLSACSGSHDDADPSAPAELPSPAPSTQVTVTLTARPIAAGDEAGEATAQPSPGQIAVRGAMQTPTPCYDLAGRMARDGQALTLTVDATSREGMCVQSIGAFGYDAVIRGVGAGRYSLRVIHRYPDTGWPTRTALDTTVTVP